MRLKMRSALFALVVVCALSAVTATSALATPNYPEFKPGIGAKFPIAFSAKSGTVTFNTGLGTYQCNHSTISGEITGPKELSKVKLQFSEGTCAVAYNLGFCWSEVPHSWTTNELKGRLGYLSKTGKTVGLVFESASEPFAVCGEKEFPEGKILGAVLGSVQPVNSDVTSFGFTMNETTNKEKLEGEATRPTLERKWEAGKPEAAVLTDTLSITTAQKVEISA